MLQYMELSKFKFITENTNYSLEFKLGNKTQLRYIQGDSNEKLEVMLCNNLPTTIIEVCDYLVDKIEFECFNLIIDEDLNIQFILENLLLILTDQKIFNSKRKLPSEFKVNANSQITRAYKDAYHAAESYHISRTLNNLPFSLCNSTTLCNHIEDIIGNPNIRISILNQSEIEKKNLNGIIAVSKGASNPPVVIKLEYKCGDKPKIGLLGKGIMFDSGGYNLKSGDFSSMKTDMAGCAAVIGTVKCIADQNIEANLVAYIVATENLVNEKAYTPGDVIIYNNGVSVEVVNTDAEGRLILADGLLLLNNEECDTVIDIATLTGNSATALGKGFAPLYSTNKEITKVFTGLNYSSTDNIWPMPLPVEYEKFIQGDITDIKNSSSSKHAGSITAALFLKNFVSEKVNWVHIDMGAMSRKVEYGMPVNGFGVRLLTGFIKSYKK